MFQRSLLRQSRAVQKPLAAPLRTIASSAASRQPQPLQPFTLSSRIPAPVRARVSTRWLSSAVMRRQQAESAATNSDASSSGEAGASSSTQQQEANPLQKELDDAKKEVVDLKDKYLRQVAEYRNLQERTQREMKSAKDFAIQRFARDLIESIDNLDLALSNVKQTSTDNASSSSSESQPSAEQELANLVGGLKMTEQVLMNTLQKHGLERFDPAEKGDKFDPNIHEATFQAPAPDKEDGTVMHTTQKGFSLNGRILRAAKVGVVKNS